MTDDNKPAAVTRRELYPILGMVFLLIGCTVLGLLRPESDNLNALALWLFFGVAVLMSLTFSVLGIRERGR